MLASYAPGTVGAALAGVMLCGSVETAAASDVAATPETIRPILIGSTLPGAAVRTVDGDATTLRESITGPAVLVVYRGGWCPMCQRQFAALRHVVDAIAALDVGLYAMSVDDPERLRAGHQEAGDSPFTLISDVELHASKALGLAFHVPDAYVQKLVGYGLDTTGNAIATEQILPVPAVFVVDAEGVITFSYVNPNYVVRCDPNVVLAAAKAVAAAPSDGS